MTVATEMVLVFSRQGESGKAYTTTTRSPVLRHPSGYEIVIGFGIGIGIVRVRVRVRM